MAKHESHWSSSSFLIDINTHVTARYSLHIIIIHVHVCMYVPWIDKLFINVSTGTLLLGCIFLFTNCPELLVF